eukprot:9961715-Heterocapsa_arctica.AAC.2
MSYMMGTHPMPDCAPATRAARGAPATSARTRSQPAAGSLEIAARPFGTTANFRLADGDR